MGIAKGIAVSICNWGLECRVQHQLSRWGDDERRSDPERDFNEKGMGYWWFGAVIGHCKCGGGTVGLPGFACGYM
jgi:hypothetical protein